MDNLEKREGIPEDLKRIRNGLNNGFILIFYKPDIVNVPLVAIAITELMCLSIS